MTMQILLVVLAVASSVVADHADCDPMWTKYDCKCYRLFNNPKLNWEDANTYCRNLTADLVTISNEEENNFVYVWWKSLQDDRYHQVNIGYNDRQSEGSWQWASGSSSTYTKWEASEPNNGEGSNQDCGAMWDKTNSGTWDDNACTDVKPFICEKAVNSD